MKYDLIKNRVGDLFNKSKYLRILLYRLLDLLLLRAWYIRRELRKARQVIGAEANILDAGSGFGQHTYFLAGLSEGWHIKAIDIKTEQIRDCTSFFSKIDKGRNVRFEAADLTKFF